MRHKILLFSKKSQHLDESIIYDWFWLQWVGNTLNICLTLKNKILSNRKSLKGFTQLRNFFTNSFRWSCALERLFVCRKSFWWSWKIVNFQLFSLFIFVPEISISLKSRESFYFDKIFTSSKEVTLTCFNSNKYNNNDCCSIENDIYFVGGFWLITLLFEFFFCY
jgi:hypothetical protein